MLAHIEFDVYDEPIIFMMDLKVMNIGAIKIESSQEVPDLHRRRRGAVFSHDDHRLQ